MAATINRGHQCLYKQNPRKLTCTDWHAHHQRTLAPVPPHCPGPAPDAGLRRTAPRRQADLRPQPGRARTGQPAHRTGGAALPGGRGPDRRAPALGLLCTAGNRRRGAAGVPPVVAPRARDPVGLGAFAVQQSRHAPDPAGCGIARSGLAAHGPAAARAADRRAPPGRARADLQHAAGPRRPARPDRGPGRAMGCALRPRRSGPDGRRHPGRAAGAARRVQARRCRGRGAARLFRQPAAAGGPGPEGAGDCHRSPRRPAAGSHWRRPLPATGRLPCWHRPPCRTRWAPACRWSASRPWWRCWSGRAFP